MPKPVEYTGFVHHTVDTKRRVQIPAKWRPEKSEGEESFEFALMLWPHEQTKDEYIQVLPPEVFAKLKAKVTDMPFADPAAATLRRWLGTRCEKAPVDSVGRVCLPGWMAEKAGIKEETVMVGTFDRFEVWSPERYEKTQALVAAQGPEALVRMI